MLKQQIVTFEKLKTENVWHFQSPTVSTFIVVDGTVSCGIFEVSGIHNLAGPKMGIHMSTWSSKMPRGGCTSCSSSGSSNRLSLSLCTSITVWIGSSTKQNKDRLQRTLSATEKILGTDPPTIQDFYNSKIRKQEQFLPAWNHSNEQFISYQSSVMYFQKESLCINYWPCLALNLSCAPPKH